MKKAIYVLCLFVVVYVGLQLVEFKLNEPYRNRFNNEAYLNGEISITCYNII